MKNIFSNFMDTKILPFAFANSKRPILFLELLKANMLFHDGGKLDGNVPGVRLVLWRGYLVFLGFWHLAIIPVIGILHKPLADLNCHLSIILAIIFTVLMFVSFGLFKEWLVEQKALNAIKEGWRVYFPHFSFDLHSKEVAEIYAKAIEKGVAKKDMQMFIFTALSQKN